MRILALETSTRDATVAVLEGDRLLNQAALDPRQRTAQAFAPAIAEQLRAAGWQARDLQLIVVSQGPGSFTGLRVGVTAAKTLAYATGAQLIGVNTLLVIASQVGGDWQQIDAVVDAQRQQVVVARFHSHGGQLEMVGTARIVDNDAWLASLEVSGSSDAGRRTVTGPALVRLRSRLPEGIDVMPPDQWAPQAATTGRIGHRAYREGRRDDLWTLVPHYYRPSAAEEAIGRTGVPQRSRS